MIVAKTIPDNLVVVAAYDKQYIDGCLESLGDKYPVVVMDTSGGGHPTGAYIRAFKEHPAKNYFFMQDSMKAKQPDFLEPFIERLPGNDAVAWAIFKQSFDTATQEDWAKQFYKGEYPGIGIFGPIFYTSRDTLKKLEKLNLLPPIPTNKAEAQSTERMWSWSLFEAGMKLAMIDWWDDTKLRDGSFPIFTKTFGGRA